MIQSVPEIGSVHTPVAEPPTGFAHIRGHIPMLSVILVGGALATPGTSSAESDRIWDAPYMQEFDSTASGLCGQLPSGSIGHTQTTQQAIFEIRRISGLTWEQLGELFGVTRRGVHYWASGKSMNAENEQRLMRILDAVQAADRGDARATRTALFEIKDGKTGFALMSEGRFQEAGTVLGAGVNRESPDLSRLSKAASSARKPLSPASLVDARNDRVHRDRGAARNARTMRTKRRGSS